MTVPHLAFDLRTRDKSGNGVDDKHIDRVGTHQCVGDFQRLFASIRLGDDQFVNIHTQFPGIDRVKRMLRIDEGRSAAILLGFRDDMERQRRLSRTLRPIDFNNTALGQATDTEGDVETERACRDRLDIHGFPAAKLHCRALAERAIDLGQCGIECFLTVHVVFLAFNQFQIRCHDTASIHFLGQHQAYARHPYRQMTGTEQEGNRYFLRQL